MSSQVDMLLNNSADIADMLTTLSDASKIELHDEGEYVYESLMNNVAPVVIVRQLNKKYGEKKFSLTDLRLFLQRNPKMARELLLKADELMDTHVKTYMNHELALMKLYDENRQLMEDLKIAKDPENLIKALKSMKDIIMDDAKLRGRFKEGTEINFNVQAKEMVNQVINEPTLLQKQILEKLEHDNRDSGESRTETDSE